ncbi:hypothetical protein EPA93_00125 [Ktedonosporobacter rubrisoli]|uniref:Transposase IS4-like domain-containing protein n=1 Tax=Ktedonosporobacter rubrisoli TaxID=2509675 RepID=A0A4P6JHR5_KTERU|nr:hypothetical protein [Ktedonosporobacter rubrisoli]QBD74483.1 hypothetical protein EPA93_00125 [Ktedonosporobacter rubrisoli]
MWQIVQGKRYLGHKLLFDPQKAIKLSCDIWWAPVWRPSYAYQVYLIKVRVRKKIWYLIANERIATEEQACEIIFLYRSCWQIETSFRYEKSELALESPRIWSFENRLKLLGIVTLVYAFLLHLLDPVYRDLVQAALHLKCHRSRLWEENHPALERLYFPPNEVLRQLLAVSG